MVVAVAAAAAAASSTWLTCALLPRQGLHGIQEPTPGLQWTNKKRCCTRKAGPTITAKLELKPPPYPLNRRPDYISTFMEKLVSWEAVSSRLETAKAQATEREEEEKRKKEEKEVGISDNEAVEMFVDSTSDDSEAE